MIQVTWFKRQRAAETKLQEIKERKERHARSLRAAALSAPIETGRKMIWKMMGRKKERLASHN